MRVAIVHYWLIKMRGGEKVLENLCKIYPNADIYTHVYNKNKISTIINNHTIKTTFIHYLPFSSKFYKLYLPLMPLALKLLNLKKYDLIISSESGPSKGFIKSSNALHVCYCHSPMRYLYDMKEEYLRNYNFFYKKVINLIFLFMKKWDIDSSKKIDLIIANSNFVANRIKKYWKKDSQVIYPSINIDEFFISNEKKDYYLVLSELNEYKRIDIAIDAFNKLNKPLYIIGDGPLLNKFKNMSNTNITFLSNIDNRQKSIYLSKSKALVFPGIEDFGIVPLESMASGTPVIAYKKGGVLDYLEDGLNGIFFNKQSSKSLINSIKKFEKEKNAFDPNKIRKSVLNFTFDNFSSNFNNAIKKYGIN